MHLRQIFVRIGLSFTILLAGCATSYGPSGLTGGYKEEKVDERTYTVAFYGNGHTSGDTVWNYWIYRCAELTKEKGFTAFTLAPIEKKTALKEPQIQYGDFRDENYSPPKFIQIKGGGAPSYYYVPGGTITTYSAKAIVTMYSQPYPSNVKFLLNPDKVIEALKPYVDSSGKTTAPARREILDGAIIPSTTPT